MERTLMSEDLSSCLSQEMFITRGTKILPRPRAGGGWRFVRSFMV